MTHIIGLTVLIIVTLLYLGNMVDMVAVFLAGLGWLSISYNNIMAKLGEKRYRHDKVKVKWHDDRWTFSIGNNYAELSKKQLVEFINQLQTSLNPTSDKVVG